MTLRTQIPAFYWYFGTLIDPLLAASGAFIAYFSPQTFMDPGFAANSPYGAITPSHIFMLNQIGGAFAAFFVLQFFLLRETSDMNVWTRFQQALCFADVAVLYSQYKALEAQGRLGLGELRTEEAGNAVLLLAILVIRLGFIAGVGFGTGAAGKKRV